MKKVFYLVTPLPLSQLQAVNCLVRGTLEIPQQLVLKQVSSSDVALRVHARVIYAKMWENND